MENTRYDYSAITKRPPLILPEGARLALWLGINVEYFDIGNTGFTTAATSCGSAPDVFNYAVRDYGNRVGIWRFMELLDRHGLKASVNLNSDVCEHYPVIVEECRKRDWEFLGHGTSSSCTLGGKSEAEERQIIATTLSVIAKATGKQPLGWQWCQETFNTPDILAEQGVRYLCDWCCDDEPFPMNVKKDTLISMPYSLTLNDIPAFLDHHLTPSQFYQMIVDQFDTFYREGSERSRVMCIALHPFLIGQPYAIVWLDKALQYIRSHKDVWLARACDIAKWYYEKYLKIPFP